MGRIEKEKKKSNTVIAMRWAHEIDGDSIQRTGNPQQDGGKGRKGEKRLEPRFGNGLTSIVKRKNRTAESHPKKPDQGAHLPSGGLRLTEEGEREL